MNDLQKAILNILIDVDKVCRKHKINYFLDGGTALGAVRHGGFIPWDDDIDIGMLREDYEKFLSIAQEELGDEYFIQTIETEKKYYQIFAKVRKNNTLFVEPPIRNLNIHKGIFIDIFPFDYLPKNNYEKYLQKVTDLISVLYKRGFPDLNEMPRNNIKYYIKNVLHRSLYYLRNLRSKDKILNEINNIIQAGREIEGEKLIASYAYADGKLAFDSAVIFPVREIKFEGYTFFIHNDPEKYLKMEYGDYMKLPDEKDRITHKPLKIKL
ncbi:MAG: LicD family protein [Treponema sp.]|nr:LicD family protein [Treponema sp.]